VREIGKRFLYQLLWNPKSLSSVQQWKEIQLPARELGLELHSMEASSADKFVGARWPAKTRHLTAAYGTVSTSGKTYDASTVPHGKIDGPGQPGAG
jgi:hypothetical protein